MPNHWIPKVYEIHGHWNVEAREDQHYFVLKEDFAAPDGADLNIYLMPETLAHIGNRDMIENKGGIRIGELEKTSGAQEYLIPEDFNWKDFASIVIYCRQDSVVWAGVDLSEVVM
ncbi:MAG: DM13 domain-containing protein [Bacteroidota bacterium]